MLILRKYKPVLTVTQNVKGVLDVDTVKGCTMGMASHSGGCYGECYAAKTAARYGVDFSISISRYITPQTSRKVFNAVGRHSAGWYRIGVAGDPSHDWDNTVSVCEFLSGTNKIPVIVTKHWNIASNRQLRRLAAVGAVFNTSVSGMDNDFQVNDRVTEIERIRSYGMVSVCRVVTCQYGSGKWADRCRATQNYLLSITPIIDTPFRTTTKNPHVINGEIILTKCSDSIGGGSRMVSLNDHNAYLGKCLGCPDQCGVSFNEEVVKSE